VNDGAPHGGIDAAVDPFGQCQADQAHHDAARDENRARALDDAERQQADCQQSSRHKVGTPTQHRRQHLATGPLQQRRQEHEPRGVPSHFHEKHELRREHGQECLHRRPDRADQRRQHQQSRPQLSLPRRGHEHGQHQEQPGGQQVANG
jgi:hypothetical protein